MYRESITWKDLVKLSHQVIELIFHQFVAVLSCSFSLSPVKRLIIILKVTKYLEAAFTA